MSVKINSVLFNFRRLYFIDNNSLKSIECLLRYVDSLKSLDISENLFTSYKEIEKAMLFNKVKKHKI